MCPRARVWPKDLAVHQELAPLLVLALGQQLLESKAGQTGRRVRTPGAVLASLPSVPSPASGKWPLSLQRGPTAGCSLQPLCHSHRASCVGSWICSFPTATQSCVPACLPVPVPAQRHVCAAAVQACKITAPCNMQGGVHVDMAPCNTPTRPRATPVWVCTLIRLCTKPVQMCTLTQPCATPVQVCTPIRLCTTPVQVCTSTRLCATPVQVCTLTCLCTTPVQACTPTRHRATPVRVCTPPRLCATPAHAGPRPGAPCNAQRGHQMGTRVRTTEPLGQRPRLAPGWPLPLLAVLCCPHWEMAPQLNPWGPTT